MSGYWKIFCCVASISCKSSQSRPQTMSLARYVFFLFSLFIRKISSRKLVSSSLHCKNKNKRLLTSWVYLQSYSKCCEVSSFLLHVTHSVSLIFIHLLILSVVVSLFWIANQVINLALGVATLLIMIFPHWTLAASAIKRSYTFPISNLSPLVIASHPPNWATKSRCLMIF